MSNGFTGFKSCKAWETQQLPLCRSELGNLHGNSGGELMSLGRSGRPEALSQGWGNSGGIKCDHSIAAGLTYIT